MKSFETSGIFVQEMILVALFFLILVEIRLLCIQHSRKRKAEVMAVNFLLLIASYGILTDLLSDYLAIWEGKNRLLHIAARWPVGFLFFLILADNGYLIRRIRNEDEKYKKDLSVYSIKQTLDHLKCGICFCDDIGQIVLCNEKMYQLGYMLTGENLQSYLLLKEALEAKQYSNGISKVGKKKNLYYFPNGTVWDFRQEKLEDPSLQGYIQVLALDVTNLYFNSEKIQKSNEELIRLNKEIRKMYECIDDQIREEETRAMKIRIHDSFGRSLLAVRQLLEEEAEPEKMKGQLKTIRQTAQILLGNMEEVQDENKESITEKAEKLGITVFVTGSMPEEEYQKLLIDQAIMECMTNCARHAGGTRVFVKITNNKVLCKVQITNNGKKPAEGSQEGGGLTSLRKTVEREGGNMQVIFSPEFELILLLSHEKDREIKSSEEVPVKILNS